ncbi:tRNA synthetases class I (M)-domain-containing protein [Cokeromyces recurvatus]|uniref:tRNA synthetases class I (M)-domain-containing protein n=1 Tax=Cokeromyces recurvatus TaxID=90255 RepID=UPI00221F5EEE|nr:tRNA synthetases class I (M)-domain-containing protein [Cokeromyces recurvatus]KAI7902765.1 tRNA synthetases class I (M)-domain-containing protein [Cokeromyces recurvatus]
MPAAIKITLPKLAANTKPYANALKLSVAAKVTGAKLVETSGDAVTFVSNNFTLTDANAALKYIFNATTFNALQSTVIEKEETLVSPLIIKRRIDQAFQNVEDIMNKHDKAFAKESDKVTVVDVIYYGTLVETLSSAKDLSKYPVLSAWFATVSKNEKFVAGVEHIKEQTNKGAKPKNKTAHAEKKVTKEIPKPTFNPTTQKVNKVAAKIIDPSIKVLPKDNERNVLITSALPYVNNVPHLGNIVGSTLSADVYARYCRARGYNTAFFCGTDEYGTATETKALEEGVSCRELCDKYNAIHTSVYKWFDLSFDLFGRTTTEKQTKIAQDIFLKNYKNGNILKESMIQLYCEKCNRFLADRYVEGICPHCKYDDARGDQCDACGKLLNATELVKPRCKLDGNTPITRESNHLFLDLGKLQPEIEKAFKKSSTEGKWSANGINITQSWLKEGLKPRCITRDLKWGTPVPLEGYENKVFYVWFDAPIGYPSITANYTDEWEKWWKNPDNVKLYQFMGKDNVPFHSVIFPGCEVGTGEKWTVVNHISTCEYLNYEGGKFSKSRNVGVFGNNAQETGIPPSVWRYYLMSVRPETSDSMFTWNEFITKNNSELLNNLGNFVNRAIRFIFAKYDGVIPKADFSGPLESELIKDVNHLLKQYIETMEAVKLRAGLGIAMTISARGNQYLQEANMNNALFEESRTKCDAVVATAANLIYLLSALLSPYMPATAESMCRQLNAPLRTIPDEFSIDILEGHVLGGAEYLFTRIDEKMEDIWKKKYGTSAN